MWIVVALASLGGALYLIKIAHSRWPVESILGTIMDIHQYRHILSRLDDIEWRLIQFEQKETQFMADMATEMAALAAQVKANTDAEASAVILINGIAARITAAAGDPAQVTALAAQLKTSADALASAVLANTPAAA